MASKANRRQIATVAMFEALVDMMMSQGLDDDYYIALQNDIKANCDRAYKIMNTDKNGCLTDRDISKVKEEISNFGVTVFGEFIPEHAISFCICMISDQTVKCKNAKKLKIFEELLHEAENLLVYFDPDGSYCEPDGFDAATIFEELAI